MAQAVGKALQLFKEVLINLLEDEGLFDDHAVEVIDDPATARAVESWGLDELDIADAVRGPLADFAGGVSGSATTPRSASCWARTASIFGYLIRKSPPPGG